MTDTEALTFMLHQIYALSQKDGGASRGFVLGAMIGATAAIAEDGGHDLIVILDGVPFAEVDGCTEVQ